MPINGSGVSTKPPGTTFFPNTEIESAPVNSAVDDIYAILNTPIEGNRLSTTLALPAGTTAATATAGTNTTALATTAFVYAQAYITNVVSGVGTVERSLKNNLLDHHLNVMNYGAVSGGDLLIPLQRTIDALVALGGGTAHIPALPFTLSDVVNGASNVQIVGAGRGATVITCTSATADMLAFSGKSFFAIRDLTLDNSATKTAGKAISIASSCSVGLVNNVEILNHFRSIAMTSSVTIWVNEVEIGGIKPTTGIGVVIDGGNDHYLTNVFCKASSIGTQSLAGVNIVASGGTWMLNCGQLWTGTGRLINPGNGQTVEHIFSAMCHDDTCSVDGLALLPTGTGVIRRSYFMQDWSSTCTENGVTITAGSSTIDGIALIGHRSLNNQKHGLRLSGGLNVHIKDGQFAGNGGLASNTYDGILVIAGTTDFMITGNRSGAFAGFTNIQRYGINIASGASDSYIVTGNDTRSNVTGGLNDGGTGIVKQVFGNIPISTVERARVGGVNMYQPTASGWQIDSDQSSYTIATGAETVLTTGSGMLVFTDNGTGGTAIFVTGGGGVALIGQTGTAFAATSTPSASQLGLYYSGGAYRLKNGFADTRTVYPGSWKTRPAN